jgi:hypothetical protein
MAAVFAGGKLTGVDLPYHSKKRRMTPEIPNALTILGDISESQFLNAACCRTWEDITPRIDMDTIKTRHAFIMSGQDLQLRHTESRTVASFYVEAQPIARFKEVFFEFM